MFCGQWLNAKGEVGPLRPAVFVNVSVNSRIKTLQPQRDEAGDQQHLKLAA